MLVALAGARAEENAKPGVSITFLPPPLEGLLNVGIYNAGGKLVRILARDATDKNFIAGLNGFITSWDGKDDSGMPLPAGQYFVRGFAVGGIEVEGVAYHGNDWIEDDEAPHLADIRKLELPATAGALRIQGVAANGTDEISADVNLQTGRVVFAKTEAQTASDGENKNAGAADWAIERAEPGKPASVVQRAKDGGDVLRRLDYDAADPQPESVLASPDNKQICLLERNDMETRVRILTLQETTQSADGQPVSKWGVVFRASIWKSATFAQIASHLERTKPPVPLDRLRVPLRPNELSQPVRAAVQVNAAVDAKGAVLQTTDGLPLSRLSETPNLKWAVLSRDADGKQITMFQSDGAVVEEFRLKKLDQMMAFDAGEYDWTPVK